MCIDSESLSIKNRRREKGCTRPIASESRGELMRFAGKSGSPRCNRARPAMTPWTIDKPTSLSLPPYEHGRRHPLFADLSRPHSRELQFRARNRLVGGGLPDVTRLSRHEASR